MPSSYLKIDEDTGSESPINREDADVEKTYDLFDLLCVGVGATVGSGVFVLTGLVAHGIAGPGVVISWIIAGCACCLSATSFAELSSRFPHSTSSYTFVRDTLGPWAAYLAAWCLSLECGISAAAVARSWGKKLSLMIHHQIDSDADEWGFNLFACLLQTVTVLLFLTGKDISKMIINIFTVAKVLLVVFMIVMGFCLFDVKNLQPSFTPMGWDGVLRGATLCFFGFVGYDEVCCLALETKGARKLMPTAVFGTISIVCLLYGLSSLALVGMEPFQLINEHNGYSVAFMHRGYHVAGLITAAGEMAMLPLVVILSFLPQPRILAALARDRLAPHALAQTNSKGNFEVAIFFSGSICVLIAAFVPFILLNDLISSGVLLSFNFTNTALILVRRGNTSDSTQQIAVMSYFSVTRCSVLLACFHILAIILALQLSMFNTKNFGQEVSLPVAAGEDTNHAQEETNAFTALLSISNLGMISLLLIAVSLALFYLCPDQEAAAEAKRQADLLVASPTPSPLLQATTNNPGDDFDRAVDVDAEEQSSHRKQSRHRCDPDSHDSSTSSGNEKGRKHDSNSVSPDESSFVPSSTDSMQSFRSASHDLRSSGVDFYRTPGVPFVPLLGIIVNYILIFQLNPSGLAIFVLYFAFASIVYALQVLYNAHCSATGSASASYQQVADNVERVHGVNRADGIELMH